MSADYQQATWFGPVKGTWHLWSPPDQKVRLTPYLHGVGGTYHKVDQTWRIPATAVAEVWQILYRLGLREPSPPDQPDLDQLLPYLRATEYNKSPTVDLLTAVQGLAELSDEDYARIVEHALRRQNKAVEAEVANLDKAALVAEVQANSATHLTDLLTDQPRKDRAVGQFTLAEVPRMSLRDLQLLAREIRDRPEDGGEGEEVKVALATAEPIDTTFIQQADKDVLGVMLRDLDPGLYRYVQTAGERTRLMLENVDRATPEQLAAWRDLVAQTNTVKSEAKKARSEEKRTKAQQERDEKAKVWAAIQPHLEDIGLLAGRSYYPFGKRSRELRVQINQLGWHPNEIDVDTYVQPHHIPYGQGDPSRYGDAKLVPSGIGGGEKAVWSQGLTEFYGTDGQRPAVVRWAHQPSARNPYLILERIPPGQEGLYNSQYRGRENPGLWKLPLTKNLLKWVKRAEATIYPAILQAILPANLARYVTKALASVEEAKPDQT